ncbi:MAG: PilZ domain-containing protein [Phycisphaerales bacterium]|nr:MAG: PilZ domain-containing protein [Phycisphaerales bacterium]
MKDRIDKRKHQRLPLNYDISCRKVGSKVDKSYYGRTVNVRSGGLYFDTTIDEFERGDVLKVVLEIPPRAGLLEFGGKLAGYANVLRTERLRGNDPARGKYGVAAQFCRSPKLCL